MNWNSHDQLIKPWILLSTQDVRRFQALLQSRNWILMNIVCDISIFFPELRCFPVIPGFQHQSFGCDTHPRLPDSKQKSSGWYGGGGRSFTIGLVGRLEMIKYLDIYNLFHINLITRSHLNIIYIYTRKYIYTHIYIYINIWYIDCVFSWLNDWIWFHLIFPFGLAFHLAALQLRTFPAAKKDKTHPWTHRKQWPNLQRRRWGGFDRTGDVWKVFEKNNSL